MTVITREAVNQLTQILLIVSSTSLLVMVLNNVISKHLLVKQSSKKKKKLIASINLIIANLSQGFLFLSLSNVVITFFLLATMEKDVLIRDYLVFSGLVYFFVILLSFFNLKRRYHKFVKHKKKRTKKKAFNRLSPSFFWGVIWLSQLVVLLIGYLFLFSNMTPLFYLYAGLSSIMLLIYSLILKIVIAHK